MTNEDNHFPQVAEGHIGGEPIQTVNARDLHSFLQNGDRFSGWVKALIE